MSSKWEKTKNFFLGKNTNQEKSNEKPKEYKPNEKTQLSAIYFRPCVLKFKKDNNSKPIKLDNMNISSFVIKNDSFAVVQNFKVMFYMGTFKGFFWGKCRRDFAKVLQQGKISSFELPCNVFLGQYGYQDYSYIILTKDNQNFRVFDLKKEKEQKWRQ